ncbi:MAG: hypothetical protein J7L42_01885 [Elusimicrobia bacterium]|nr:hypothetical protein [Elusimicrobiota bacterium]
MTDKDFKKILEVFSKEFDLFLAGKKSLIKPAYIPRKGEIWIGKVVAGTKHFGEILREITIVDKEFGHRTSTVLMSEDTARKIAQDNDLPIKKTDDYDIIES